MDSRAMGPKALWRNATDDAEQLIWESLDELAETCRQCGHT